MLANHHAPALNDSPQGDSDYEIILAALMESARGRSFLEEYGRRNRTADTATLLTAIGRIENLLTSRSLEPAEPAPADCALPSESAETPDDAASDTDIMAADIVAIEGGAAPEPVDVEMLCVEVTEFDAAPAELAESVPVPLDVAAPQASAIEFLGPDLTVTEPARPEPQAPAERPKREPRDPFADIRALSDAEKIALFT